MKRIFTYACMSLVSAVALAQAPGVEWQKTYGGDNDDKIHWTKQSSDGGYILAGYSFSGNTGIKSENTNGGADYWVIKTDATGEMIWQNNIGGDDGDHLYDVVEASDGSFILAGYSYSELGGDKTEENIGEVDRRKKDYWVIKLNTSGTIVWQNTIGGDLEDNLWSIDNTADGGYILGGYSASYISGDKLSDNFGPDSTTDYWIVKLNSDGDLEWQRTIGGNKNDELYSIHQCTDGGFILGGGSNSDISGNKTEGCLGEEDYWIIKLNAEGDIEWQNTIGGNGEDEMQSIIQTADGGYLLGGYSDSEISGDKQTASYGKTDFWIVKLNASGIIEWQTTIGGNGADVLHCVIETNAGNYIAAGKSRSNATGNITEPNFGFEDYFIVELNPDGNIRWQKSFGGSLSDELYSIQQTSDNGFIISGFSKSEISGNKSALCYGEYDYWLIKLFPEDNVGINEQVYQPLKLFPDPATEIINLILPQNLNAECTITITNLSGEKVYSSFQNTSNIALPIAEFKSGLYIVSLSAGSFQQSTTFIKQ